MDGSSELQQVIYDIFKTQIRFGAYKHADRLPTIEEASGLFSVSVKTIRAAYHRLQRDGLITISKNIGVKVKAKYDRKETEIYFRRFFAGRETAMLDLGRSMRLLFDNAQWIGFKNASPELLDRIEKIDVPKGRMTPAYIMIGQLRSLYGALENELLTRLVWQSFMFFLTPFLSVPIGLVCFEQDKDPLRRMIDLCRKKNWTALRGEVDAYQEQKLIAFRRFYQSSIKRPAAGEQTVFEWSVFEKTSQICYSLGMKLLIAISQGVYPVGSFIPSLSTLARENHVSVNTARRTVTLLNEIGATAYADGRGIMVLPPEQIAEHCDLSRAPVKKRLLNYLQSFHILVLSCRQVAEATVAAMDRQTTEKWQTKMASYARDRRYELLPYAIINLISEDAPFKAVRTIYADLFRLLFWGYPVQSLSKDGQRPKSFYVPYLSYFQERLESGDAAGFAASLEELMIREFSSDKDRLVRAGLTEASALVIDKQDDESKSTVACFANVDS